jgi:hypothetical protein
MDNSFGNRDDPGGVSLDRLYSFRGTSQIGHNEPKYGRTVCALYALERFCIFFWVLG